MKYWKWLGITAVFCITLLGAANVWANDALKPGARGANPFDQFDDVAQCKKLFYAKQYKQAFPVCKKAAKQGEATTQFNLGLMYAIGQGVKQDYAKAANWWRKAAKQGIASAQINLGLMYANGQGVQQDYVEALKWYRKAAEQGDANAQNKLGLMYENGQGVQQNYSEAIKWYRKAAEQGDASAQSNLGGMYANGHGVHQDYSEAVKWWRKAAKLGYASARFSLGVMYANGQGVQQNYSEAIKWYRKAAEQGDASAQSNLGVMYENGQGVKQDYSEAIKWSRKAAEQGDAAAQLNLGLYYLKNKEDVNKYSQAIKWLIKSAEQRTKKAENLLFFIASYGVPEAIDYWNRRHPEKYLVGTTEKKYSYFDSTQVRETPNGKAVWVTIKDRSEPSQKYVISELIKCNASLLAVISMTKYEGEDIKTYPDGKRAAFIPQPGSVASNVMDKVCKAKGNQTSSKVKQKKVSSVVSGTGWPVAGGYVVTNHHVIAGRKTILLYRTDGVKIQASVAVDDAINDLVLLKPDNSKLLPPALPLANRAAQVGGHVFTVGYPHPDMMGKEPKLTDGIINARTGLKNDPRVYQISVPLQGGNSGGPLINMRGEVVGVTTAKMSAVKVFKWTGDLPQNVNYAVKIGYVRALLSSVDPASNVPVLPVRKSDLAALAKRIEKSVLIVIAQ